MSEHAACPQNFKVWVAFVMGMVIIVIAIVVFDRVLGMGRFSDVPGGSNGSTSTATRDETTVSPQGETLGKTATYLALTGGLATASAWLGIEGTDVSAETARMLGLDLAGGVLVSRVVDRSPADEGGIQRGDIIYNFDRRDVSDVNDLTEILTKLAPGDRVRVVLLRDGSREVLYIELGEAPAKTATDQANGSLITSEQKWGIVVSEITPELRRAYDIPKREEGVVIVMVLPNSAASRAGLRRGDLIKQVDRENVTSLAEFFGSLSDTSRHVLLKIFREGADIFIHVVAVSPFMRTGGAPFGDEESTDTDSTEEEETEGYEGKPETLPPMGKPGSMLELPADSTNLRLLAELGMSTSVVEG